MDNNVTACNTIERCGGTKSGFPSTSPQDLINNNNNSSAKRHKTFGSTIACNHLQNNELIKSPIPPSGTTSSNSHHGECPEPGSLPDADFTESLVTATEALTEILVNTTADTNGNNASLPPQPKHYPNMSSSSTQTECTTQSSSYRVCCCKEWNCWKASAAESCRNERENDDGSSVATTIITTVTTVAAVQCSQSAGSQCCHRHRRKKSGGCNISSNETAARDGCSCTIAANGPSKYTKSWRELRKTTSNGNIKRPSNVQLCRFQSCNNRNPKPVYVYKKYKPSLR